MTDNLTIRSKTRVVNDKITSIKDIKDWSYDGSSCNQTFPEYSEIILKPVFMCIDPFQSEYEQYLILCETYQYDLEYNIIPTKSNKRYYAQEIYQQYEINDIWFGIEQEYFFLQNKYPFLPLGWIDDKQCNSSQFYCSIGIDNNIGRNIVQQHMIMCLKAGIKICGTNQEVVKGQYEFQIGICSGIEVSDHLIIARYLLSVLAEKHNIIVSFEPKLFNDKNGSGLHTNVSTIQSRQQKTGLDEIYKYMKLLDKNHDKCIQLFGDNSKRLTGKNETSNIDKFTYGIGDRTISCRIGVPVFLEKCGYFEDRRPASNGNPYQITSLIITSIYDDQQAFDRLFNLFIQ